MATLTITTQTTSGSDYLHNIGRAARALLTALIAVPHKPAAAAKVEAVKGEKTEKDVSIYRLYRMAAQYDSVMPSMAQELRAIAARNPD